MSVIIQLDDQTAELLRRLAFSENRPEGEVLRDALSAYAEAVPRALPRGIGKYHSGQSDVSTRDREIRREAAKEEQWP